LGSTGIYRYGVGTLPVLRLDDVNWSIRSAVKRGDGLHIFERMGVPVIINAKGPATRLSGALMAPEVGRRYAES